ncbi:MAG: alpha/beta hydrolase [Nitrososphaerales archaeon]|jgi:pimeloyl-ACP methyl ester carboxylesterase
MMAMEKKSNAPGTPKSVELGEYRVSYVAAGAGPSTMLMLHGADKRDDWRVWEPLMGLSSRYALVIPDLVGFGRSTVPAETPDYRTQARVMGEMMERLGLERAVLVGTSWGGQVALEMAINRPQAVEALVLVSSTYDKAQLPKLKALKRPTLIVWAEDDRVAQLKAGYLLRDSIRTSRLEILGPVANDPGQDFTIAHKLERHRADRIQALILDFLSSPAGKTAVPPELEPELRGLATRPEKEGDEEERK